MQTRARFACAALGLVAIGLLTRLPHAGPPGAITKYAGAILWGAMVYCVTGFVRPQWRAHRLALVAGIIAAATEFSQLWHTQLLDDIRRTTIGVLLIGRYFAWADIAAYFTGIAAVAALDHAARRRAQG